MTQFPHIIRPISRRRTRDAYDYYNTIRLHSAIDYVTPLDKLLGREQAIFSDERDRKLAEARERRAQRRQQASLDKNATLATDRAEDTALRGRNRSADPVAEAERRAAVITSPAIPTPSALAPKR